MIAGKVPPSRADHSDRIKKDGGGKENEERRVRARRKERRQKVFKRKGGVAGYLVIALFHFVSTPFVFYAAFQIRDTE